MKKEKTFGYLNVDPNEKYTILEFENTRDGFPRFLTKDKFHVYNTGRHEKYWFCLKSKCEIRVEINRRRLIYGRLK